MKPRHFRMTRRAFVAASATTSMLAVPGLSAAEPSKSRHLLRYTRPAGRWEEALPVGNGRLGAMIFGRVAQERLQLNEDTLWAGAPYTPDNPDALIAIPQIRKLIEAGNYAAATELASAKAMAKPLTQMPYGSLGDVLLDFAGAQNPSSYERTLNLETALASTRYVTQHGTFLREVFSSAPDQVLVQRLEALQGSLDFAVAYRGPRRVKYTSPAYSGSATNLIDTPPPDWLMSEAIGPRGDWTIAKDGDDAVLIGGRNEAGPDVRAGLTFALRIKILTDGVLTIAEDRMKVSRARTATILLCGATSFVNYLDVSGDPIKTVRRQTDAAATTPYGELKRRHIREYQSLFGSAALDLHAAAPAKTARTESQTTDLRIASAETSDDPALAALYFQYSRYLLISSSRPGCQPANLQGIWNEGVNPPWGSKYTININTEMNYWLADPAGLGNCVEPLVRMVEALSMTGAKTAKTMYAARGWVAHHNTDLWRASAPIDGPLWGLWPCGGAWLCNALWDHYDYSRDTQLLRRIYPLLQGASLFFLDTLQEDPRGRGLITSPSLSPEHEHPFGTSLCAGPAMDRQIIRDLFEHTVQAAKRLDLDAGLAEQIGSASRRLAPDSVGESGQLQEWLEDWDAKAPDPHHRHVSHLYAVYPSSQINVRDTPQLIEAAKTSLRQRGDLATGWGTAWRLCLWARMGEAEHAHSILKALLGPQRTYPNMFDAHPPFQIDGNFGGAAGIAEMLLQSWGDEIRLLPALPAAWPSGELRGFRARGAVAVDLMWRASRLRRAEFNGPAGAQLKIRYGAVAKTLRLDARGRARMKV
jgi:alpha-L-fucosidase 2